MIINQKNILKQIKDDLKIKQILKTLYIVVILKNKKNNSIVLLSKYNKSSFKKKKKNIKIKLQDKIVRLDKVKLIIVLNLFKYYQDFMLQKIRFKINKSSLNNNDNELFKYINELKKKIN